MWIRVRPWAGAGREATSHEIYFGTNADDLPLADSVAEPALSPGSLDFGTTYYWRVDEAGDEVWAGDVWTFSTKEYALIDGFETYNDDVDAATTIFDTWIDGWVNGNGSTVGYFDAPFAERKIVHSGSPVDATAIRQLEFAVLLGSRADVR